MKRILLTATALVLAAGASQAEITWSGSATAGLARQGKSAAVAAGKQTTAGATAITDAAGDPVDPVNEAGYKSDLLAQVAAAVGTSGVEGAVDHLTGDITMTSSPTVTELRADITELRTAINAVAATSLSTADAAVVKAQLAVLAKQDVMLDAVYGSAAVAEGTVGDWDTYSEVNATATASVAMDNGMTLSVSASVDAGIGYDFADDDGFDAAKTNGVGLDSISLDMGSMGKLTLDEDAIAHLVDGDDDEAADVSYTNTFGTASVTVVADMDKDGDAAAAKAGGHVVTYTDSATTGTAGVTAASDATAAVAADVAWSAKISMPLAGGTGYVAMDEEGGNAFGATATLGGVGISFDSKLEALEEELSIDRSNTIGLTYAMGATTFGATWNSVEDGDQWGISAAYAADGLKISASTDEGSDWSVSGSMDLGNGASVVAGTNYTEDAYVGVSFAF